MSDDNLPAVKTETKPVESASPFASEQNFELAQRMAKAFASSDLVPTAYRGNTANALIAMELASRLGTSPLMVAQNLNIIHGRPSWSSTFIIASINTCGKFAPLKFKVEGSGDDKTCTAWTTDKAGEVVEGPPASIKMAKLEGWMDKVGSKWKTMPDLMLRYRAAAFFGRLYASEILLGMKTEEEERDMVDVTPKGPTATTKLNEKIKEKKAAKVVETEPDVKDEPHF